MPFTISMKRKGVAPTIASGRSIERAPLLTVSIGTAGCNRNRRLSTRMGDAGQLERIQSVLLYDFNQETVDTLTDWVRNMNGTRGPQVLLPNHVRAVDGFLSDPDAYKRAEGLIDRDLDEMIEGLKEQSQHVGAPPQLIIEYLGFGGHAKLGGIMHEKLKRAFDESIFMPIILLPRDPGLEKWMRQSTWEAYEQALRGEWVLVTDNMADDADPAKLDDRLAVGLATLEAARFADLKGGSLPEAVTSLRPRNAEEGGWLGLSVIRNRLPAERRWSWTPPFRRMKLLRGRDNELTYVVRSAIWETLKSNKAKLNTNPLPKPHAPHRIAVTLPVTDAQLLEIEHDVRDQLKREHIDDLYPNLVIGFGTANFPDKTAKLENRYGPRPRGLFKYFHKLFNFFGNVATLLPHTLHHLFYGKDFDERFLYLNVASLYPLEGPIHRVQEILHADLDQAGEYNPKDRTSFGTLFHINNAPDVEVEVGVGARTGNGNGNSINLDHNLG